jgi:hypothetical protein
MVVGFGVWGLWLRVWEGPSLEVMPSDFAEVDHVHPAFRIGCVLDFVLEKTRAAHTCSSRVAEGRLGRRYPVICDSHICNRAVICASRRGETGRHVIAEGLGLSV